MNQLTQPGPPILFDRDDVIRAHNQWGFNCGPAAIAALLLKTPAEVRPHLGTFEAKRHMNSLDVSAAVRSLGFLADYRHRPTHLPARGLARIQWGGPWLAPGVHKGAAAARTHWIASWFRGGALWIYDINGDWQEQPEWKGRTVLELMATVKRCDRTWGIAGAVIVWAPTVEQGSAGSAGVPS